MKVYLSRVEPEKYPVYNRRYAKAITREALGNKVQFATLRSFPNDGEMSEKSEKGDAGMHPPLQPGTNLVYVEEMIDMYVNHFGLGKVLWPVYPTLFADNFEDLVDICVRDGLYLYDFWGFVPGSAPSIESIWGEYKIPSKADRAMREKLKNHFFGYDNGEQDGRYVHALASRTAPLGACRKEQYENFQAYFEKIFDAMLNHTVTLASLTFLHYFAKEGNTIMLGAETAQALPSSVMWFAFIRGASKQYGLLNYGNASVWNRWGYKDYAHDSKEPDTSAGYEMGRFAGTSLSLLRRLLYNHYMYNCDILGFENCWLNPSPARPGDVNTPDSYVFGGKRYDLTPIGKIQRYCARFVEKNGDPGTLYTPLAIVADFFSGWVPPRHLYTKDVYKVWGNLPYNTADHQLHALFSMLLPGYENAGFYRDERGFSTPTPYGEIADVLLSDAQEEILARYPTALILESVDMNYETYCKFKKYVAGGGTLVIFAETVYRHINLSALDDGYLSFFGLRALRQTGCGKYEAEPDGRASWVSGNIAESAYGEGRVKILLNSGLVAADTEPNGRNEQNADIARPYEFSDEIRGFLDKEFSSLSLLGVHNPALHYCVCVRAANENGDNEYTLYVANDRLCDETYDIISSNGTVTGAARIEIDDGIPPLEEFLPLMRGVDNTAYADGEFMIKAGDCHIYRVTAREKPMTVISEKLPSETGLPLYLSLPRKYGLKDYLLHNPTFLHHFKGLAVNAEYFERIDGNAAEREAHYAQLQNARVIVDFTRMLNHYPDLSLIGNIPGRTHESICRIEKILDKAALYGCDGAVFSSHRLCENEYTLQQGKDGMLRSWKIIQALCEDRGVKFFIQNRPDSIFDHDEIKEIADNYALNTAYAHYSGYSYADDLENAGLLLLSASKKDSYGQPYAMNLPLRDKDGACPLAGDFARAVNSGVPVILCAQYEDWDGVYADLECLYARQFSDKGDDKVGL